MTNGGTGAAPGPEQAGPYFAEFVAGRRGQILDAASCVFAEKGYEGGTMREIAARVGVTEPALYRHYAGKEALFEDLVAVAGDRIVGQVALMLPRLRPESLRESLRGLIELRRREGGTSVQPIMRTLLTAAPHNPAFREAFRMHVAGPMIANLGTFVPRMDAFFGIARTPESQASSLRAFLSLFVGYFITGMMLDLPDDDDAIIDAIIAIMGWEARA
jgi:AcrR family transcriptional regulator